MAPSGFEPQPTAWQCGPFALKHALLCLGVIADARVITRVSGATEEGADETDLGKAAAHFGFALGCERHGSAGDARQALAAHLAAGTPVLLCVDGWEHWLTAVSADDAGVVLLDSRLMGVFHIAEWSALLTRLAYRKSGKPVRYDLHPVLARGVETRPARLGRTRVRYLLDPAQRGLTRDWGRYLSLLLPLHHVPTAQMEWTAPLSHALRDRAAGLLDGIPSRHALRAHRRITHAAFVADAHELAMAIGVEQALAAALRELEERAAAA